MKRKMKFGYLWVTLGFFAFSLIGHWLFSWFHYQQEQIQHGQTPDVLGYVMKTVAETFENWQSEFLQLLWQVGGLTFLWYVGSPQSKEGDERREQKLDEILRAVNPAQAQEIAQRLERQFPKK